MGGALGPKHTVCLKTWQVACEPLGNKLNEQHPISGCCHDTTTSPLHNLQDLSLLTPPFWQQEATVLHWPCMPDSACAPRGVALHAQQPMDYSLIYPL